MHAGCLLVKQESSGTQQRRLQKTPLDSIGMASAYLFLEGYFEEDHHEDSAGYIIISCMSLDAKSFRADCC
ncbi:hypothetical protein QR680_005266 [Steinernema hermaphroditum]|uniref:Uncharacterized protein n=1 Tax=Steinernema hermaphroditum TaxID=289476 RepID=A0AA39LV11_9BILA|nr:hypothetical protein QR680_005266 [Steinernema hermaphroditum]